MGFSNIANAVIRTTNELKNKAIISLKEYYMHCYGVLSNIMGFKQDFDSFKVCMLLFSG